MNKKGIYSSSMTTPTVERLESMTYESDIIRTTGFPVDALQKLALSLSYETPHYIESSPVSLSPAMLTITAEYGVTFATPENNMFTHIAPQWSENVSRFNPVYAHFGIRMEQPAFRPGVNAPLTIIQGDTPIRFFLKKTEIGQSIGDGGTASMFKYTQDLRRLLMGLLIINPSEFGKAAQDGIVVQEIHRYQQKEYMYQSVALPAWILQENFKIRPEPLSTLASLKEIAPNMLVLIDPERLNNLDAQQHRSLLKLSVLQKVAHPLLVRCETPQE